MTTTNRTWPEVPDRCAGRGGYKGEPRCRWLAEGEGWRCVNPYQSRWSLDHGNCLRYEEGEAPQEASSLMERAVLGEFTP